MKKLPTFLLFLIATIANADLAGTHVTPSTIKDHHITLGIYPIENSTKHDLVICFLPANEHYTNELRCVVNLEDFQAIIREYPDKNRRLFRVTGDIKTLERLLINFSADRNRKDSFFYSIKISDFIEQIQKKQNKAEMATPGKPSD